MTQQSILELAKQGDAKAIASLLNRQLQTKGITATVALKDGCLQVMLEAVEVPSQQVLAAWVSKSISGLKAASIEKVKVYGRQTGAKVPAWNQKFEMAGQKLPVADVSEARSPASSEVTESKPLSLKERAKLGDVEAIASLLNLPLQNKGISATASLQDGCLQVMLEGDPVPDEELAVRIVRRELTSLKAGAIGSVKVYGQQVGEDFPAWNREFEIVVQVSHPTSKADTSTPKPSKKFETEELVEMLVPGLKQLKNGMTGIGVAWLVGAFIGYLWMFWVGLIIHAIYIWKYNTVSTKSTSKLVGNKSLSIENFSRKLIRSSSSFKLDSSSSKTTPQQQKISKSKAYEYGIAGAVYGLIISLPSVWAAIKMLNIPGGADFTIGYIIGIFVVVFIGYLSGVSQGLTQFAIDCPNCNHKFILSGFNGNCPACSTGLYIDECGNAQVKVKEKG